MYDAYGADTFRVYEMSMGPLELGRPWETRAVVGSQRFLQRLWRNVIDEATGAVIVTDDAAGRGDADGHAPDHRRRPRGLSSTCGSTPPIAKLIELNNVLTKLDAAPRAVVEALVVMVAPVAPHIAEELWLRLGHEGGVTFVPFPQAEPSLLVEETVTCVIQIKGKVRDRVEVAATIGEDELRSLVLRRDKVVAATPDGVRTVIVRAPKLVNVVPA